MTNQLEIKLLLTGLAQVKAGLNDLSNTIKTQLAGAYATVAGAAGLGSIAYALGKAAKTGLEFNAELEQARIGIASILRATNPGEFKSFNDAFKTSTALVEKLKKQAMESPATFKELVAGFQSIAATASAAGVPLKKQTDLIVVMSQALAALGVRSDQMVQESNALISGNIDKNAVVAKRLQITAADIEAARQQGRVYEFLMEKLGAFSEANKVAATSYTVTLSNLKDAVDQTMGAATAKLFEETKGAFLALTAAITSPEAVAGLTEFHNVMAQVAGMIVKVVPDAISNVSSVVGVVIEEWKAGRIAELIGLTIEAGFEIGKEVVVLYMDAVKGILTSSTVWKALASSVMGFGVQVANTLVDLMSWPVKAAVALTIWSADRLRWEWQSLVNAIGEMFTTLLNKVIGAMESTLNAVREKLHMTAVQWDRISNRFGTKPDPALSWAQSWEIAKESTEESSQAMKEFFSGSLSLAREAIGMNSALSKSSAATGDALQRWSNLITQFKVRSAKDAAAKRTDAIIPDIPGIVRKENVIAPWLQIERKAKEDLLVLDAERARMEGNFAMTKVEKWSQQQAILKRESDLLTEVIAKLKEQAKLSTDPKEAEHIMNSITAMEARMTSMTTKSMTQGPDPTSMVQQLKAAMTELRDEWGTLQQSIAKGFKDVIGAGVQSVSQGISGLIKGTLTWAEALRNIGSSLMNAVIDAIARMFAEWIVGRLAVKAVEMAAGQAEAAAKAPGALFSSISSYGVAGILGTAALIAGIAAISGAFADGGRPPVGQMALVGERGPELFVPDHPGVIIPADITRDMIAGAGRAPVIKQTFITAVDRDQLARHLEEHIDARVIHVLNTQS